MATIFSTHTQIIFNEVIRLALGFLRLVSMADSRTEKLRLLLTASNQSSLYHSYVLYVAVLMFVCFPIKRHPQIVAAQELAVKQMVAGCLIKKYGNCSLKCHKTLQSTPNQM